MDDPASTDQRRQRLSYSRTTEYVILALAERANRESDRPAPTRDIAEVAGIPHACARLAKDA